MKLHFDQDADALYLRLDNSNIVDSEEVSPGLVLDCNGSNELVGVEILILSRRTTLFDPSSFAFETSASPKPF